MVTIQKSVLRKEAIRKRDRAEHSSDCADKVARLFFKYLKPEKGQIVSAYWPIEEKNEFDTRAVLNRLDKNGVTCALPISKKGERVVDFAKWTRSTKMAEGLGGIMEPQDVPDGYHDLLPDIIICPLLAYDRKGFRLGYGGGNYDATMERLRKEKPDCILVGFAFSEQEIKFNLPHEDHDIPCDWVITPEKVIEFCHTTKTHQANDYKDKKE